MGVSFNKILDFIPGYQAWRARFSGGGGGLPHASIEVEDESKINNQKAANYTLADARDYIRNNSFAQTILNQLQVNVVGTVGGRLAFATDDENFNDTVNTAWARFSAHCGFRDGCSWNRILKDIVGALFLNGGDILLVFDDGQITGGKGTGKVLTFESDQIANADRDWFKKTYPKYHQRRGVIYDEFYRVIGYFASKHRGLEEFKLEGGKPTWLTFIDESGECDPVKRNFILVKRTWRPNQDRGVSALTHVLNELRNLDDLGAAETASAKLNAHIGLAITEDTSAADAAQVAALMSGEKPRNNSIKFDAMLRQQSAILQLPQGKKVEAFKTDRPNDRVPEYIQQLQSAIVAVFGLGKQFFTLTPESSFTAHRGAMQMAWQTIKCLQDDLGGACEWLASQWFYRQRITGGIAVKPQILADIDRNTEWSWQDMPEVDNVSYQNAIAAAFNNGTLTMRKLKGAAWRKDADQQAIERKYYLEKGTVYPGDKLVSGGVAEGGETTEEVTEEDNGEE